MTRQDYDNSINEINKAIVYGIHDPHKAYLDLQNSSNGYITSLEARIQELETPRSCDGCKHYEVHHLNSEQENIVNVCTIPSKDCARKIIDYYEPKGNK